MAILTGPDRDTDAAVLDLEVTVGRRDEDLAGPQLLAVGGRVTRQRTGARKDARERARAARGDVHNDADRGGEIGRETGDDSAERLHTARRSADHDEIVR